MRKFLTLCAALLMVTFSANADLFTLPNLFENGSFEMAPDPNTFELSRDVGAAVALKDLGAPSGAYTGVYLESESQLQGFIPYWETPILGGNTDFGGAGADNRGLGVEVQVNGVELQGQGNYNSAWNFSPKAADGSRWIELDTHKPLEGIDVSNTRPTNSWLTQTVSLTPGFYEAGFMYMPREVNPPNSYTTNAVGLYISGPGISGYQELAVADDYRTTNNPDWMKVISDTFSILSAGDYSFTLAALGASDGLGGLIDNASLARTGEIPEPGTYALVGIGLIGLYFVRRRRQA